MPYTKVKYISKLANWVVLCETKKHKIVTYGLFSAIGAFLSILFGYFRMIQFGIDLKKIILPISLLGPIVVYLGSRFFGILGKIKFILENLKQIIKEQGLVYFGGYLFGILFIILISILSNNSTILVLDCFAMALPLASIFGRIGCFTYGCCYGKKTNIPWAIKFTRPESKAVRVGNLENIPIHPTQIYLVIMNIIIFIILNITFYHRIFDGQILCMQLILYSIGRIIIESFRDYPRGYIFRLSISQFFSIIQLVIGIVLFFYFYQIGSFSKVNYNIKLFKTVLSNPSIIIFSAITGLLIFLFYGIHGKKIGSW